MTPQGLLCLSLYREIDQVKEREEQMHAKRNRSCVDGDERSGKV